VRSYRDRPLLNSAANTFHVKHSRDGGRLIASAPLSSPILRTVARRGIAHMSNGDRRSLECGGDVAAWPVLGG